MNIHLKYEENIKKQHSSADAALNQRKGNDKIGFYFSALLKLAVGVIHQISKNE